MLSKRLIEIIKNPSLISEEDIEDLKLEIEKYPFFSILYVLLAKKLNDDDNICKNKALELASIYSVNRSILKKIISSKFTKQNKETVRAGDRLLKPEDQMINNHKKNESLNNLSKENINYIKASDLLDEEDEQENLALESICLKNDLITENLAKIMVQQGKISDAKYIYKQLCLKLPQKKAYFVNILESFV